MAGEAVGRERYWSLRDGRIPIQPHSPRRRPRQLPHQRGVARRGAVGEILPGAQSRSGTGGGIEHPFAHLPSRFLHQERRSDRPGQYRPRFATIAGDIGQDTPTDLYWGLEEPIWESGELVTLLDSEDTIQATFEAP